MTKKKTKKETAIIEGKIDSKLINSFDGEFENLSEVEAEVAKNAISKVREMKKEVDNIVKNFYENSKIIISSFTKLKKCEFSVEELDCLSDKFSYHIRTPFVDLEFKFTNALNCTLEDLIFDYNENREADQDELDSSHLLFNEVNKFIKNEVEKLFPKKKVNKTSKKKETK